jgi:hypothetical protein
MEESEEKAEPNLTGVITAGIVLILARRVSFTVMTRR